MASLSVLLLAGGCKREPDAAAAHVPALPEVAPDALRPLEAFAVIPDRKERSRALFLEASRVLFHPRCANCHPSGESPLQGDDGQLHYPPVVRGPEDQGVVGMECTSCHQDKNQDLARVPGAPKWHVAPMEMAWVGKSPREVCEQLKDTKRNGGKTPAQMIEHNAHDELVAWGWNPGMGRKPAPGTQAQFGAIVAAWVETGSECPSEEARP
ncbi:hypothetical protein [Myxococcus hansupus]|nr:hypothetical protein [Myxococcus hansupus]